MVAMKTMILTTTHTLAQGTQEAQKIPEYVPELLVLPCQIQDCFC